MNFCCTDGGFLKMAKRKKQQSLMVRCARRILGILLIFGAFLVLLGTAFFSPADNAYNVVSSAPLHNHLGRFGALSADWALVWFGLATPLFIIAFLRWGWFLLRLKEISWPGARVLSWLAGISCLAVFFSIISRWLEFPNLGGAVGINVARHYLSAVNIIYPSPYSAYAGALFLLLISFFCFNFAARLSCKDWWNWLKTAARGLGKALIWFGAFFKFIFSHRRRIESGNEERIVKPRREKTKKEPKKEEPKISAPAPEPKPASAKPAAKSKEPADGYNKPPVNLLSMVKDKNAGQINEKELDKIARDLENVLQEFGVNGKIVKVRPGPVVTLYELEPAPGTKTARVIGLADDIARSMSAVSVRIAVVPGSNTIGIEMPNQKREIVWLRELFEDDNFMNSKNTLNVVLGKDIGGKNVYADLAKMPHLLVAGTTGSGKSVGVNSMILSLLYRMRPDECKLIMIDPKMLEFSMYNGIPHLLTPVITDPGKAVVGLKWAVKEMEDRYRAMAQLNVRNISGYNQKLAELRSSGEKITRTVQTGFDTETGKPIFEEQELDLTPLPYIVIVVDEMADLMLVAGKEVEAAIQRLAQMARAAGLHLIMSTQRPSVDVITGTIKANFPTRISFQVTSKIDSRTILGEQGAEQLLGMGDMLYMPAGQRPIRVHGSFVKDSEVEKVVDFLKEQKEPEYVEAVTAGELNEKDSGSVFDKTAMGGDADGDLYSQAVAIVQNDKKVSTSYIQRRLRIGYNRAATLVERMEEEGVITAPDHTGRREVIGV